MEKIQQSILQFVATLHPYDYYGLIWLLVVLFFLLVFIYLIREKVALASILSILFFALLIGGPPGIYYMVHKYLYATKYSIEYVRQMHFAKVLIIKGSLQLIGKEDSVDQCKLYFFVLPKLDGFKENLKYLYFLKPLKKGSLLLNKKLEKGDELEFKMKFYNFVYSKEINSSDIYIYRNCYKIGKR
jgi:hypothetical protein